MSISNRERLGARTLADIQDKTKCSFTNVRLDHPRQFSFSIEVRGLLFDFAYDWEALEEDRLRAVKDLTKDVVDILEKTGGWRRRG